MAHSTIQRRETQKPANERYQAIPHRYLVLQIPRQMPCKKLLLVEHSPYESGDHRDDAGQPPPRTERDRYAKKHHNGHCVHRVAHERIRTCGNDLLVWSHFKGGGRERIFSEYEVKGEPGEFHERVSREHRRQRHVRPYESVIECREDNEADECNSGDECDYLLSELLLGSRTSVYPSLQELRVVPYQVDGYRQVRCEIDGHERPCLPVSDLSRVTEQQRRHDEKQEQHPAECLYNQDPHFAPLLERVGKAGAKSS